MTPAKGADVGTISVPGSLPALTSEGKGLVFALTPVPLL